MKILIAGAGAVGGWLGAHLHAAGQDVTLLGRQSLIDAIATDGLRITGHTELHAAIPTVSQLDGQWDVIFITCKAHATHAMATQVTPSIGPGTILVSLQNGLGNAEILAQYVPRNRVVVGSTSHGVMTTSPGQIVHAGRGHLRIGAYPAPPSGATDPSAARHVMQVLESTNLSPEWMTDTLGHLWLKAAVNVGLNPLCALHGTPNGGLTQHMDEALGLVDEIYSLTRAAGVKLPGDPKQALRDVVANTAENRCSMLQDLDAKRPTEIEQITGYFVRVARRLGYPLFENEDIYQRVKTLEASYLGEGADATTVSAAKAFVWDDAPGGVKA
jgi:2-dehydropantoate 2-reductase